MVVSKTLIVTDSIGSRRCIRVSVNNGTSKKLELFLGGKQAVFSHMSGGTKMSQTIAKAALARFYDLWPREGGWAFSLKDLKDLGRVDMALKRPLKRLADQDTIRPVIRGVYDYPKS